MIWYDYLLIYISCCASVYFVNKACGILLNKKINKTIINLILILLGGMLITCSVYKSGTYEHILLSLIVISIVGSILYKDNICKIVFNTMICYIFVVVFEILLSVIIVNLKEFSIDAFNSNSLLKAIYSIIDVFLAYLTCTTKPIKYIINKITNKNVLLNSILSIVIIALIILDAKYLLNTTNDVYIGNIIILACLLYLLGFSLNVDQKLRNENEKTEILLNFMTKYEKIIDDDRIYKHELLNNLLMLKSIKNKNSKEFNNLLSELIKSKSNNNISIKNIYNLPSGLKGIFYYKLYNLQKENYNVSLNISKKVGELLKNISHKDYIDLYKIIGIVLNNAIEASSKTKDKYLLIDIYQDNSNICFDISNSFEGKVNLNNINNKGISTKGKNRGIGLYLANRIISQNEKISMDQSIENNIFITKIKVSL